ncbi:hypothetical protein [uncultured Abyssibacter sp.]|uniref:hypothetical protein n=1 Tax=uncultured Abyssibacter sp. TaxID=2320202 RepID=UPI0032B24F74
MSSNIANIAATATVAKEAGLGVMAAIGQWFAENVARAVWSLIRGAVESHGSVLDCGELAGRIRAPGRMVLLDRG